MMMNKLKDKLKNKGEMKMKTESTLLEVNGVKTPDLNEPKGELFEKKVNEATAKINRLKARVNQSLAEKRKIESEIQKIKHTLIIEEDPFEVVELKKKRRELEDTLQSAEDLSDVDVNQYAKDMLETNELKKLYQEARAEYIAKSAEAKEYQKKLNARYQASNQEVQRFIADYGSDSHFRTASNNYNQTKNL